MLLYRLKSAPTLLARTTCCGVLAACAIFWSTPVRPQVDPGSSDPLVVVSFNLAQVPGAPPSQRKTEPAAWRTTFGSERRSPPPRAKEAALGADIVLLQGVSDMATLRQWLPPRTWKLVVSRQILSSGDEFDAGWQDGVSPVPTTAIAIRYQPGLRVTAQEHLLELAKSSPTDPQPQAAGTAVRVKAGSQIVWVLSADLAPSCLAMGQTCQANSAISRWRDAKRDPATDVIVGGHFRLNPLTTPTASAAPDCGNQTLQMNAGTSADVTIAAAKSEAETGCTATLEFYRN